MATPRRAKRSGRVTERQRLIIIEFMEANPRFNNGQFAAQDSLRLWSELTEKLNSVGRGPKKDAEKWKTTWRDIRSSVKIKASKIKASLTKSGGRYVESNPITALEERILRLMGISPPTRGIEDSPESGSEKLAACCLLGSERRSLY